DRNLQARSAPTRVRPLSSGGSPARTTTGTPEHHHHGAGRVLDGDTIVVSGKRIRLEGIDAPEGRQPCFVNSRAWACGTASTAELRRLIGSSPVGCVPTGRDRYGRTLARCHVRETDI